MHYIFGNRRWLLHLLFGFEDIVQLKIAAEEYSYTHSSYMHVPAWQKIVEMADFCKLL